MVTFFGKGEILKGSDAELTIELVPCNVHADIDQLENYICYIYTTPGGFAIARNLDYFEIVGNVGTTHLQRVHLDKLKDGVIRYTIEFDFDGDHYITEKNTGYYLKTPINYTPVDVVDRQEMEDYVDEAVSEATSGTSPTVFLRVDGNGSWIQQEEDGSDLKAFVEMARVDPTKCCTVYIDNYGQQLYGTVEYSKTQGITDRSGITHNGAKFTILQPVTSTQAMRYSANAYADEYGFSWFGGRNFGAWEWVNEPGQGTQGLYFHVDITDPDNPVVTGFGIPIGGMYTPVVDGYVEIDDSIPAKVGNIKDFISGVTGLIELREYCNIWCYSGGSNYDRVAVRDASISTETNVVYMEAPFYPPSWDRGYFLKMYLDGRSYFYGHSGPIRIHLECTKEEDATGDFVTSAETQQMISAATQNFITSADTQDFLTSADTQDFITSADTSNFAIALTSVNKIWGGSAQAYSALTSYDNDTIYFVDPQ